MTCSVCGSSARCGCNQIVGVVMTGSNCESSGTCCENVTRATPQPFYSCAPSCAQGHEQKITVQQFAADIKIQDSWNVPACGQTAVVTSIQLFDIVVGSYIWNPTYGFFEITAFNPSTNQITVLNHCNDGNATVGTNVPSCTTFTVTVPPCDCSSSTQTCVAIDFTAPDVDDCIDITLTNTDGIASADTIQIGSGRYFVQEVKANDIITICNAGEGITPGTPVIALNAAGDYQYCIAVLSSNPCAKDSELVLIPLGCNGDGVSVPFNTGPKGWVLQSVSDTGEDAEFKPVGAGECTQTTANIAIVSGTDTYTDIPVADSNVFEVGFVLYFGNSVLTGNAFTVTDISDSTHITGTFSSAPSTSFTLDAGTVICPISCCDAILSQIQQYLADIEYRFVTHDDVTLNNGSPSFDTSHIIFSIVNPSTLFALKYALNVHFNMIENMGNADVTDDEISMQVNLNYDINSTPRSRGYVNGVVLPADFNCRDGLNFTFPIVGSIAAGGTDTFDIYASAMLTTSVSSVDCEGIVLEVSGIKVALS